MQSKMIAFAVVAAAGTGALAQNIEVTFENLQAPGGLSFTPLWLGLGDGSFDVFTPGSSSETPAFDGITQIAEVGDTAAITSRFDAEQAAGSQTTLLEPNGPPVFSPGESATATLNSSDASIYRFLNFASMVVPSNDLFVGNSMGIEVFDAAGNFNGPITIEIVGGNVWDNGSEINDITDGPAFIPGIDGGAGTAENGVVTLFFDDPNADSYLQSIFGTTTGAGDTVTQGFSASTPIARLTIVPGAGTTAVLAAAGFGMTRRRR